MKKETFELIDAINQEGIENGIWSMYDLHEVDTKEFFGTSESMVLSGQYLVLYVRDDDYYAWVKPETSDIKLTIAHDEKLHLWKI